MEEKETFKPKRGQIPIHFCSSCNHCKGGCQCSIHNRRVDTEFNRCFSHSYYQPNAKPFKVDSQLDLIMKQEQAIEKKRQQGWMNEHNKMVEEIKKDIETAKNLRKTA